MKFHQGLLTKYILKLIENPHISKLVAIKRNTQILQGLISSMGPPNKKRIYLIIGMRILETKKSRDKKTMNFWVLLSKNIGIKLSVIPWAQVSKTKWQIYHQHTDPYLYNFNILLDLIIILTVALFSFSLRLYPNLVLQLTSAFVYPVYRNHPPFSNPRC